MLPSIQETLARQTVEQMEPLFESMRLQEASAYGDFVPWSDYPQNDWPDILPSGRYAMAFTTVNDREDGRCRPLYDNEMDLRRQTAMVRRVIGMNELTEAVTTALKVYIFGQGIEVTVNAKPDQPVPPQLVDNINRVVQEFSEKNSLVNSLDVEGHQRSREDGETLWPIEREGNHILCDAVDAVQLTEPRAPRDLDEYILRKYGIDCSTFVPSWKFGVLTSKRRTGRPYGYHVLYDGVNDWEFYPSDEFVHIKRNVPRSAKRGVSDFLAVKDRLFQAPKLATNMAHGAALQSAIAWIENNPAGTAQGQSQGIGNPGLPPQQVPNGWQNWRQERQMVYGPGSILRPSFGRVYVPGPMGAERNMGFQVVEEILERLIGIRWLLPYQMISGDYSNNAYASSLQAESPFVKAREADQQFYGGAIKSLLWKVVKMAWKLGWVDLVGVPIQMLMQFIDIDVKFVSPATRDKNELVKQLTQEVALGTTSIRTAANDLGRNYDSEVANGAKPEAIALPVDPTSSTVPKQPGAPGTMTPNQGPIDSQVKLRNPHDLKPTKPDSDLDPHQVDQMTNALQSGKSLPPVEVDDEDKVIAGHHRLAAHKKAGKMIPTKTTAKKGEPLPNVADQTKPAPTGINAPSARQFDQNTRAIQKTLLAFQKGGSRTVAKGILISFGVPDAMAEEFLNDAAKGKIDVGGDDSGNTPIKSPGKKPSKYGAKSAHPTVVAATRSALESVESGEEALQVLESLGEFYP